MTCIVGLETKKGVIIGGDSSSVSGWNVDKTRLKKVFQRGEFLIGFTTSFRMGQLLQYTLDVERQKINYESDLEYLATTFVNAIRDCLKIGGFRRVENEQEEGGTFLVGYRKRLYTIDSDFQVNSHTAGYTAIGGGYEVALGNLVNSDHLSPKKRVIQALKAAGHFRGDVCGPYCVEVLA